MTYKIVGRPKRTRPTDRVNYKIDSRIREILSNMSERKGRNESSQVERLILQGEAIDRLISKNEELNIFSIEKEVSSIWQEITNDLNEGI